MWKLIYNVGMNRLTTHIIYDASVCTNPNKFLGRSVSKSISSFNFIDCFQHNKLHK